MIAAGVRRIRVRRWHPDNPWPHADVDTLIDSDEAATGTVDAVAERWSDVLNRLAVLADLAGAMGDESYATMPEVAKDPRLGSFQVAALSPLGAFDRQKLLGTTSVRERVDMLAEMLGDVIVTLRAARTLGGDGGASAG